MGTKAFYVVDGDNVVFSKGGQTLWEDKFSAQLAFVTSGEVKLGFIKEALIEEDQDE